ncbi:MAG: aminoacyl-tRNA hydrolase [Candidatus Cloacimonetes bacterium]|nr:aminoacyl-tRNA hydrolase [Candidatus Cloacimonadota bacterium]
MKLIVGLGNYGKKYSKTRHNIGFMVIDTIVKKRDIGFKKDSLYHYSRENDIVFLKPTTFMNLSGAAVSKAIDKFDVSSLLVIYDDIYLPLGEIRIREKGTDGGHKGVRSIIDAINDTNFTRMRVGIGSPKLAELANYVLSNFSKKEEKVINETKSFACGLVEQFITGDYKQMIDYFSKNSVSYSEKILLISES